MRLQGFTVVFIAIYISYNPGDYMVGDYMLTTMNYIPILARFSFSVFLSIIIKNREAKSR